MEEAAINSNTNHLNIDSNCNYNFNLDFQHNNKTEINFDKNNPNETKLFKNSSVSNMTFKEVAVNNNYEEIKERNTTHLPNGWELVSYKDKQKVYKTLFLNKKQRIITMTPPFSIDDFRLFVKSHNLALDFKLIDLYKNDFVKYCAESNENNEETNKCPDCFICQNNLVNLSIDHYVKNLVEKKIINALRKEFDDEIIMKIYKILNESLDKNDTINHCLKNYLIKKRVRKAISRNEFLKKKRKKQLNNEILNIDKKPYTVSNNYESEFNNIKPSLDIKEVNDNEDFTAFPSVINVFSYENSIEKNENLEDGIEIASSVQNHKKTNLSNCYIDNPKVLTKYSTRIGPFNLLQKLQKDNNLKVSIQFTSTNDTPDGSSMTKCIVTCSEFSWACGISVRKNKKEAQTIACQIFLSKLFPDKLWKDLVFEVTGDLLVE